MSEVNLHCPTFHKGKQGYEEARCNAVWNSAKPERYPDIIVQATSEQDVVAAVKYAVEKKLKIGIRSGGHSWTASFLRDEGMLIDVSRLREITVDPEAATATAGPGAYGGNLNEKLRPHGFMFPSGHCPTVGLGGYLLQGGLGWNSRSLGLGCENVLAMDMVTADGNLLHASPEENVDLYWAARGSGHGFFAVITKFYVRCHPITKTIMTSRYWIPIANLEELLQSLEDIQDSLPRNLEVSLFTGHDQEGVPGLSTILRGDCFAMTNEEARATLEMLHHLPVVSKAIKSELFVGGDLVALLEDSGGLMERSHHRFRVDNVWMDTPMPKISPQIRKILDILAPAPAHIYMLYWDRKGHEMPDMSFGLEAKVYISYVCIYTDASQDEKYVKEVSTCMGYLAKKGKGTQLGDENLEIRPSPFMPLKNFVRLEQVRSKYDPTGRFHGYMGLPSEFRSVLGFHDSNRIDSRYHFKQEAHK